MKIKDALNLIEDVCQFWVDISDCEDKKKVKELYTAIDLIRRKLNA